MPTCSAYTLILLTGDGWIYMQPSSFNITVNTFTLYHDSWSIYISCLIKVIVIKQ